MPDRRCYGVILVPTCEQNHAPTVDNRYTSLEVAVYPMRECGMDLIGRRKRVPKEHIYKETESKKPRGTMCSVAAVVDGVQVFFTSWMDLKPSWPIYTSYAEGAGRTEGERRCSW